ncbi:hypothetical protein CDL15_Pgr015773 [Punica granatum]|uniref:Heparanase-like protein 3 n=1 Tax=Punica granatum TaxID=22663 RepID=A0A218XP31_PUNGR|nr:hypothetical protein CDL15_Pgr015773 [Punica granatum]
MLFGMGSMLVLAGLCFSIYWIQHHSVLVHSQSMEAPAKVVEGTALINGTAPIAQTDDDFICATLDWWPPDKCDYGTCSWGRSTLLTLDLTNKILLSAIKAFSPLRVRMGGTLQDKVTYETQADDQTSCTPFTKNSSEFLGFSEGCLPMSRWDQLNAFFKQTGAVVTFGLNALYGRTISSDGSVIGVWNSSNAESLMQYTVNKGYSIHGWELGNELSGNGVGARISAKQYALDVNNLQNIAENIYQGYEVKPLILAPGGFFDDSWFNDFIERTTKTLQVVTHHIYNLGPDGEAQTFSGLKGILKSSGTSAVAWVGEAGGAYNSGRNLVTNTFVFSFWYLDQLGMSSTYDTKTYCRQTLIGGNYGLLDASTFLPNPDYYSAILWHRLMGSTVLSTKFSGTNNIRAYSHCSKKSGGVTLLLINLDGNTTVQVQVSTEDVSSNGALGLQQEGQSPRTKFTKVTSGKTTTEGHAREEYHLTAKDGNLQSRTMLLNGKILSPNLDSSRKFIPSLEPISVSLLDPISVKPFSIMFAQIPSMNVTAFK